MWPARYCNRQIQVIGKRGRQLIAGLLTLADCPVSDCRRLRARLNGQFLQQRADIDRFAVT